MTGEEFGLALLRQIQRDNHASMFYLQTVLRKVLGIKDESSNVVASAPPQLRVPPEFPQRRVKYDPKTRTPVDSVVVNSMHELGQLLRDRPEIVTWLPQPMKRGD